VLYNQQKVDYINILFITLVLDFLFLAYDNGFVMNKNEAFEFLNRLAAGIAKTFGNSCETVVHDMNNKKHSILVIYNGHVTKRKIGGGLDLLGTNKQINDFLSNGSDLINCDGRSANGKQIKSTTLHLQGDNYHYALGINFDYTLLSVAENAIKELTRVGENLEAAVKESGENRLKDIFKECVTILGKPVAIMNKDDRMRIVALLQERNAFSFQKSIPCISAWLHISRYTIYNYLKEINEKQRTG
jgi:predicted transcriptional regulator YheO